MTLTRAQQIAMEAKDADPALFNTGEQTNLNSNSPMKPYCCKSENELLRSRIIDLVYIIELQKKLLAGLPDSSNKPQAMHEHKHQDKTYATVTVTKPVGFQYQATGPVMTADSNRQLMTDQSPQYSGIAGRTGKNTRRNPNQAKQGNLAEAEIRVNNTDKTVENEIHQENDDAFKIVTHKKPSKTKSGKNTVTFGTGIEANSFIKAAPQKIWMHIGKIQKDVSAENIVSYITSKIPDGTFICEKLTTLGENGAFKLGADVKDRDTLVDPTFWPSGVTLRRFFLHRSRVEKTS